MRRGIQVVAVALGLVLAALGLWGIMRLPPKPSVVLADGSILQVEALTIGTNHVFRTHSEFLDQLRRSVPVWIRQALGNPGYVGTFTTRESGAYLWFSRYDPVNRRYLPVSNTSLEVLDEAGQRFRMGASGSGSNAQFQERHFRLDYFPRRAGSFRVCVKVAAKEYAVEVPNPLAAQVFPEWPPRPLPQSIQTNGFEFQLAGLQVNQWQSRRYYVKPVFQVTQQAHQRTDWWQPSTEWVDATGNRRPDTLSLLEAAWKLEAHLFPTVHYPFVPEAVFGLGKASLPSPGEYVTLNVSKDLENKGLVLAALTGPGRYSFRDGQLESSESWASGMSQTSSSSSGSDGWSWRYADKQTRLLLVLQGPSQGSELVISTRQPGRRLLVRARDTEGVLYATAAGDSSISDDGSRLRHQMAFSLKIEPSSEAELQWELIPVTSTYLEFLVAPPEPSANE